MFQRALLLIASLVIAACASYDGRGLKPGEARLEDVHATMGQPAMQWQNPDGSRQLAYTRGPAGFHTFMVRLGANGKLQSIENVLDAEHLATVRPGMSKEEVLRILGPSDTRLTVYFKARDELVWDWRYRALSSEIMRYPNNRQVSNLSTRAEQLMTRNAGAFFEAAISRSSRLDMNI